MRAMSKGAQCIESFVLGAGGATLLKFWGKEPHCKQFRGERKLVMRARLSKCKLRLFINTRSPKGGGGGGE